MRKLVVSTLLVLMSSVSVAETDVSFNAGISAFYGIGLGFGIEVQPFEHTSFMAGVGGFGSYAASALYYFDPEQGGAYLGVSYGVVEWMETYKSNSSDPVDEGLKGISVIVGRQFLMGDVWFMRLGAGLSKRLEESSYNDDSTTYQDGNDDTWIDVDLSIGFRL